MSLTALTKWLALGAESGIGKRAGDDAAEDGDDFGGGGAYGLLGDFLAESSLGRGTRRFW